MFRPSPSSLTVALLAACCAVMPLAAQQFEGVLKHRTISLPEGAVSMLLGDEDEGEEVTEANEAAWKRRVAARIFAIPADQILASVRSGQMEDATLEETTMHIKGAKIRGEGFGGDSPISYSITDADVGTFIIVSDAQKAYWRWEQPQAAGRAAGPQGPAPRRAASRATIRDFGQTATIHGQSCRAYEVVEENGDIVLGWVTTVRPGLRAALDNFMARMQALSSDEEDAERDAGDLLWEKGLPVRIQRLSFTGGPPSYDIEDILSLEQRPVPASLFAPPAGYTQKSMSDLFGQN